MAMLGASSLYTWAAAAERAAAGVEEEALRQGPHDSGVKISAASVKHPSDSTLFTPPFPDQVLPRSEITLSLHPGKESMLHVDLSTAYNGSAMDERIGFHIPSDTQLLNAQMSPVDSPACEATGAYPGTFTAHAENFKTDNTGTYFECVIERGGGFSLGPGQIPQAVVHFGVLFEEASLFEAGGGHAEYVQFDSTKAFTILRENLDNGKASTSFENCQLIPWGSTKGNRVTMRILSSEAEFVDAMPSAMEVTPGGRLRSWDAAGESSNVWLYVWRDGSFHQSRNFQLVMFWLVGVFVVTFSGALFRQIKTREQGSLRVTYLRGVGLIVLITFLALGATMSGSAFTWCTVSLGLIWAAVELIHFWRSRPSEIGL